MNAGKWIFGIAIFAGVLWWRFSADGMVAERMETVKQQVAMVVQEQLSSGDAQQFVARHYKQAESVAQDQAFTRGRKSRADRFDEGVFIATLFKELRNAAAVDKADAVDGALRKAEAAALARAKR